MKPVLPRALRRGDKVAVVSPAGPVRTRKGLEAGLQRLRGWGLQPVVAPHALEQVGYLAGRDEDRATDLQAAFEDREVRGIFAARGGYGCTRILERLDFAALRRDPVPIIGFSDLTALLAAAWREVGLVGFHGPMVAHGPDLAMGEPCELLQRTLLGELQKPAGLPVDRDSIPHVLRPGVAEGRLVGGNLSLVMALIGTRWEIDSADRIVFLEEVGEAPYRIDRMLTQLLQTGFLARAAGIVIGDLHLEGKPLATADPSVTRVLHDRLGKLKIPVAYGMPFGHRPRSWTLPFGTRARLTAPDPGRPARLELLEPAVRR